MHTYTVNFDVVDTCSFGGVGNTMPTAVVRAYMYTLETCEPANCGLNNSTLTFEVYPTSLHMCFPLKLVMCKLFTSVWVQCMVIWPELYMY